MAFGPSALRHALPRLVTGASHVPLPARPTEAARYVVPHAVTGLPRARLAALISRLGCLLQYKPFLPVLSISSNDIIHLADGV